MACQRPDKAQEDPGGEAAPAGRKGLASRCSKARARAMAAATRGSSGATPILLAKGSRGGRTGAGLSGPGEEMDPACSKEPAPISPKLHLPSNPASRIFKRRGR
jgi:hypothetical protein